MLAKVTTIRPLDAVGRGGGRASSSVAFRNSSAAATAPGVPGRARGARRAFGARRLDDRARATCGGVLARSAPPRRRTRSRPARTSCSAGAGRDRLRVDVGGRGRLREGFCEVVSRQLDQPHVRDGRQRLGVRGFAGARFGRRTRAFCRRSPLPSPRLRRRRRRPLRVAGVLRRAGVADGPRSRPSPLRRSSCGIRPAATAAAPASSEAAREGGVGRGADRGSDGDADREHRRGERALSRAAGAGVRRARRRGLGRRRPRAPGRLLRRGGPARGGSVCWG